MADTLVCSIELSKTDGITVTVDNSKDSILQTIVLNGTTIVTTITGEDNTTTMTQTASSFVLNVKDGSTITQDGRDITFDCRNWTVNATTVNVNSTGHTTLKAIADMTVKSEGSMSLAAASGGGTDDDEADSGGDPTLSLSSEKAMSLSSDDKWTASAAMDAKLSSDTKTTISGSTQASVTSDTKATLEAAQVEVSGSAQATLAGPITKVGQDVTTISGSVVSVEGNLVKLG